MPSIAALIVAAGTGTRAGLGPPKQYRNLAGHPVLRRTIAPFVAHPDVSLVQVIIGQDQATAYRSAIAGLELRPSVFGGSTRQESVRNGLDALAEAMPEFVLIHDGARPLVSPGLISRVIAALKAGSDAVLPALRVSDSLKRRDPGGRWSAVSRSEVYRAQTPQGFRFEAIRAAHRQFANVEVTDDIALAELSGMRVVDVSGEEANIKITTASDLELAERILAGTMATRTGYGFDVHRFVPGDHVWLCGVRLPHDHGLQGHSDADAGLHALTDAILGALSAGDIGEHFPPSEEQWRGAPSRIFLERARDLVRNQGGTIEHCDITLICERPKIGPHRMGMRQAIAAMLAVDVSRVSVKATTTEGLGFAGRGEGLAAQAIATIRLPS